MCPREGEESTTAGGHSGGRKLQVHIFKHKQGMNCKRHKSFKSQSQGMDSGTGRPR